MYLEIDEGFPGHRKTLRLCSLMGDPKAGWHMVWLWTWACRSCKDGNLRGMGAFEVEEAARYQAHDGKLCAAMIEAGFLDKDEDGRPSGIHNWMKRTGAAILKMESEAERKKLYRAHKDGKCGQSCEWCQKDDGTSSDRPRTVRRTSSGQTDTVQTRQDQTSPDKTRPEEWSSSRARSTPNAKIRPRTAVDLITCIRVAVEREQPENGLWNPGGSFAHKEARDFLIGFGAGLEEALETIERRIEVFAKDDSMAPWTVAKFAKSYNGLEQQKTDANGKPRPMQARY